MFHLNQKKNVHYIPKNNQIIIDPNPPKSSDGNKIEITDCILKFLQEINFDDYSFLKKIEFSDMIIRLLYLHLNLLLPFFFYKILKTKFPSNKNFYYFLLSCILFFSPTFFKQNS